MFLQLSSKKCIILIYFSIFNFVINLVCSLGVYRKSNLHLLGTLRLFFLVCLFETLVFLASE